MNTVQFKIRTETIYTDPIETYLTDAEIDDFFIQLDDFGREFFDFALNSLEGEKQSFALSSLLIGYHPSEIMDQLF